MKTTLATLIFLLTPFTAQADPTPTVSLGELTKQALEHPMMLHTGILGQDGDELRRATHSAGGDIVASAQVKKLFSQNGCGRVRILVSVPNVPTREGQTITYWAGTEMNLCADGSPAVDSTTQEREGGAK